MKKRKLIEVALPLEAINTESAREKSIRHGHPSTLHLWWARRPLAAARAVLFAQLVDDPSSHPEEFPTEELQRKERDRLHSMIEQLVKWENVGNKRLLAAAHAEILKSTGGNPPAILDPFAGGGTIPLEAQRLGLEAHASDLNPVAVLINKALIEIPPKFRGQRPVSPQLSDDQLAVEEWEGISGLKADVQAYGEWISAEAERRIGHLYPQVDGHDVIAWLWARTVTCPNPACGIDMPLVKSWWLGKKRGREVYLVPKVQPDRSHPSGKSVHFEIGHEPTGPLNFGNMTGRRGSSCLECSTLISADYVRQEGLAGRLGTKLLTTAIKESGQRTFKPASKEQENSARTGDLSSSISGEIATNPRWFSPPGYGLKKFSDLFSDRQLLAMNTFSDLVGEARSKVVQDGGPEEYADAIATYLGLGVSRLSDIGNALCHWENTKGQVRHLFGRQAIPMLWDFAEARPFGKAAGSFQVSLGNLIKAMVDTGGPTATVGQADAASRSYDNVIISTDPPYYDNIGYSDLSDFFYVWLRRSLRTVHPDLFSTMLVPKAEELVANPYRHGGKEGAKDFFETGFQNVFGLARQSASTEFPITVWYAFKASSSDADGEASTGWETLLEGMIQQGWEITSTWPNRSEMGNRMIASGTNALASSIVLSLRPRDENAATTDRRQFIAALESELPDALRKLQQGQIAPVDLPQAAIGPGMAVFSRYSAVLEPDGSKMSVRAALARINEILDQVLNEQEGDFDPTSRFAIAWYRQHGYADGAFGDANSLANARNTTVEAMDRGGVLSSRAGSVTLIRARDLPSEYDPRTDVHTSNWEALHHLIRILEADGIGPAGAFLQLALSRTDGAVESDLIKELAHLLFRVAESNSWTKDALAFNTLVTSWPEILDAARTSTPKPMPEQGAFDFSEDD